MTRDMLAPGHVSARGEDGALLDQRRPDEPDQLAQAEPVHLGPGVGEEAAVQHRDQQEHGGRHQQGAAHDQEPHCNVARVICPITHCSPSGENGAAMFLALVCVGDLMRMVRASSPKLELNSTTFILSSIMENCPAPMLTSCLCTWPTTPLY